MVRLSLICFPPLLFLPFSLNFIVFSSPTNLLQIFFNDTPPPIPQSSVVYFRFIHATQSEQVLFSGHGIRCLDLKREIYERKRDEGKINSSLDFELRVADESTSREYEDEEIVPKNASVIVRKLPPRPGQRGLVARFGSQRSTAASSGDIVITVRSSAPATALAPAPAPVPLPTPSSQTGGTSSSTFSTGEDQPQDQTSTEEEYTDTFINEVEAAALEAVGQVSSSANIAVGSRTWVNTEIAGLRGVGAVPSSSGSSSSNMPQVYGAALTCHRCKKPGHVQNNCPLIAEEGGVPFERRERVLTKMYNVAKTNVNNVTNLDEVDTKNKTVIMLMVHIQLAKTLFLPIELMPTQTHIHTRTHTHTHAHAHAHAHK
jgi:hypothetical protein